MENQVSEGKARMKICSIISKTLDRLALKYTLKQLLYVQAIASPKTLEMFGLNSEDVVISCKTLVAFLRYLEPLQEEQRRVE